MGGFFIEVPNIMKHLKLTLVLFYCLFLTACSIPYAVHYDNLKLAFLLNKDAQLSLSEIQESEVELALIKSGDRPVAVIAKAYKEFGKDKWISKDRAMLVLDRYRIARTVGFKNDQLEILTGEQDPLKDISSINGVQWNWQVDWEVGEYGYPARSQFQLGSDNIMLLNHSFTVVHIVEVVTYLYKKGIFGSEQVWENHYWIDKDSGLLLKTKQKYAPFSDEFDISFVSNAAQLLSEQG